MAETIVQIEDTPTDYPHVVPNYVQGTITGDPDVSYRQIWQRIEAHIAHRWTPRSVQWTVQGEGDWTPPLTPATITLAEVWENSTWTTATLPDGPYGYCLPVDGPYRITATVGSGTPPEAVLEAYKRLHEYTRGINFAFRNETAYSGEDGQANWAGKAIQICGAADLLRPYRRV